MLTESRKPRYATKPTNDGVVFTDASPAATAYTYTALTHLTLYTAPAEGCIIDSIIASSDDTVNKTIHIGIYDTGTSELHHLNTIVVTLGAGTNGTTQPINILSLTNAEGLPISSNGKRHIRLKSGQLLVVGIVAAPSSGKKVQVVAMPSDFED